MIDLSRVSGESGIAYLFGFVAGVLGAAYNTSGVVITIYATLRDWSPDRFRSTLQSYFCIYWRSHFGKSWVGWLMDTLCVKAVCDFFATNFGGDIPWRQIKQIYTPRAV